MIAMLARILLASSALIAATAPAMAQDSASAAKNFAVSGTVPALCIGGTATGGDETFDLGVLIDTTTGFLRTDLAAAPKTLTGSFCTARSTIAIAATPLLAQNFTATPPAGFSRSVDFTATASGWTATPASFATGASTNPAATQSRTTAFSGPITVGIGSFSTTGGSALRLVSDTAYRGAVTVTLTPAN